ncbi:hypothetical protein ACQEVF_56525 [Nonomuraea polychroma]|uniref:hypothetical protein n=1 Tax=Nonomuraea polychroma TaxID=46176 RepID=UPI003D8F0BF8
MPDSPASAVRTPLDELREALAWSEARRWWSERDFVDVVVAAEEVAGWLGDRRPYVKQHHRRAWTETVKDFTAAVPRLGPRVHAALQPQLADVETTFAGFPGSSDAPDRQPRQDALAALQRRWADPVVLAAAWQDLVDACQDEATAYDVIVARRDMFWRLAQFTGRHAHAMSVELCSLLDRSPGDIMRARVKLGDIEAAPDGEQGECDQVPDLSEVDVLNLCRRLLLQPPGTANHVVWLAFVNATSPHIVEKARQAHAVRRPAAARASTRRVFPSAGRTAGGTR